MLACLKTAEVTAAAFKGSHTSWENIGSSFRAEKLHFTANRFAVFFQKLSGEAGKKQNKTKKQTQSTRRNKKWD